jgi:hypothetical protein
MVGIEFDVVVYQIKPGFGPYENAALHVEAQSAAKVSHEMIAAGVIGASSDVAASGEVVVKTNTLQADASQ